MGMISATSFKLERRLMANPLQGLPRCQCPPAIEVPFLPLPKLNCARVDESRRGTDCTSTGGLVAPALRCGPRYEPLGRAPFLRRRHRERCDTGLVELACHRSALQAAPGQRPGPSPGMDSPQDCSSPGSACVCICERISWRRRSIHEGRAVPGLRQDTGTGCPAGSPGLIET